MKKPMTVKPMTALQQQNAALKEKLLAYRIAVLNANHVLNISRDADYYLKAVDASLANAHLKRVLSEDEKGGR